MYHCTTALMPAMCNLAMSCHRLRYKKLTVFPSIPLPSFSPQTFELEEEDKVTKTHLPTVLSVSVAGSILEWYDFASKCS